MNVLCTNESCDFVGQLSECITPHGSPDGAPECPKCGTVVENYEVDETCFGSIGQIDDYLGDGVYVTFNGYSFTLKANDHQYPTDIIELELETLNALNRFVERVSKQR